MAYSSHSRAIMAELGGKHLQDRKTYDTPTNPRNSDQCRSSDAAPKTTTTVAGSSNGPATEEASNEDEEEEEDSNATEGDDQEDEADEPEVMAPSHGYGKSRGKRPVIHIEPVDEDESENEETEMVTHETGLHPGKHQGNRVFLTDKKRTFSNVSNTSLLFGDDEAEKAFPRRKIARKLSSGSFKPLLKYKAKINPTIGGGSEHAIDSDDEDYSGVNLVPDDDDFENEEEIFIIQDELQATPYSSFISQYNDARRLSLDSHASESIFDMAAPLSGPNPEGMSLPDHGFGQFFEPEVLPTSPDPSTKRKYSDSSTKRVRFDDEVQMSDSSSSSSSDLDSYYPDLFLDQDKLPPSLSKLLENEYDEDNGDYDSPESEMSFYAYQEPVSSHSVVSKDVPEVDESDESLSGYETDLGDTTDEYESDQDSDAQPQTPLQKRSVLNRPPSIPGSKVSSPQPFERSSRSTGRAIPPIRGIFVHEDSSKAIAVTSRTTKRLTFYRPRASVGVWMSSHNPYSSSNSTNNSPRASLKQYNSDSEANNEVFNNPFSTDIMLSGIFGSAPTNDFIFGTENMGPPEAFFPSVYVDANGAIMDDGVAYDEEDDYEDDLNITDFMDFGEDADATDVEDEADEMDVPATPATSMMAMNGSTPAHPPPMTETPANRKRNTSDAMLQHFDRGVVTAFRNNQNRYRDVACLPSDPTIRASVSKPIRSGKSAEQLMTPLRKRAGSKRTAKSPFHASSPMVHASSPLSGVTKASSRLHNNLDTHPPRMGTFS